METLTLAVYILALPLIFSAAVGAFGWHYRKTVAASMRQGKQQADSVLATAERASTRPASHLPIDVIEAGVPMVLGGAAAQAMARAQAIARAVDRCHLVAGASFWVLVVVLQVFAAGSRYPLDVLPLVALTAALPGALVLTTIVARTWRAWLVVLAVGCLLMALAVAGLGWRLGDLGRAASIALDLAYLYAVAGLGALLFLARRSRSLLVGLCAIAIFVAAGSVALSSLPGISDWYETLDDLPASAEGAAPRWPVPLLYAVGLAVVPPGVWVCLRLLRSRRPWRLASLLAAVALAGIVADEVLSPPFPLGPLAAAIPAVVLQFLAVWLCFKLLVQLESSRWLASQTLQMHLCWSYLAAYAHIVLIAQAAQLAASERTALVVVLVAGFVGYFVLTHLLLRRLRPAARDHVPRRLLFLRVFNADRLRERLSDALDETWRRVGRVDLIGGADLAMRTLRSVTLECFLLRRMDAEFLASERDVESRLARLRDDLEADLRYPVNEIYCYAHTWQAVVLRLAPASHVVLLDLRGFARSNKGCIFELTQTIWHVPLSRVLVLADRSTDMVAVEDVAQSAWAGLPQGSPNANAASTRLTILRAGRRTRLDAVIAAIFEIAFQDEAEVPLRGRLASNVGSSATSAA